MIHYHSDEVHNILNTIHERNLKEWAATFYETSWFYDNMTPFQPLYIKNPYKQDSLLLKQSPSKSQSTICTLYKCFYKPLQH